MILHAEQQKRHRCKEQTFGLSGRRQGWDDLREQHWNMYITICKTVDQCKFGAWSRAPKTSVLGQPRGIGWREVGGGRRIGRTHVYLWLLHVGVWQNHHNIVIILQSKQINCRKNNKNKHTIYFTAKCCEGKCAYDIAHAILGQEKATALHSSTLAWKIPWMEEPGRWQSMGSHRVRHDWVISLSLFTFMHWRRKWKHTQCSCLKNPRDGEAW